MFVGVFVVESHLPGVNSLKDKRRIIKSISARLRNRFNISLAELDNQDVWQRTTIGISYINSMRKNVDNMFENIIRFMNTEKELIIINQEKVIY